MKNIRHKAKTIIIDYAVTLFVFVLAHYVINKPLLGEQSFPWVAWFIWANLWVCFLKAPIMKLSGKIKKLRA